MAAPQNSRQTAFRYPAFRPSGPAVPHPGPFFDLAGLQHRFWEPTAGPEGRKPTSTPGPETLQGGLPEQTPPTQPTLISQTPVAAPYSVSCGVSDTRANEAQIVPIVPPAGRRPAGGTIFCSRGVPGTVFWFRGPFFALPGRFSALLLSGKRANRASGPPKAGRRHDLLPFPDKRMAEVRPGSAKISTRSQKIRSRGPF